METRNTLYCDQSNYSRADPIVSCHTCWRDPHVNTPGSPIPWPFLRLIPSVRPKVQCPWILPQRLVHSLYVWLARGGTQVQPHRTFWGRSLAHCLYSQTVHPWLKRPHVTICYTLNFDLVTDAASRGFPVLPCRRARSKNRESWQLVAWSSVRPMIACLFNDLEQFCRGG